MEIMFVAPDLKLLETHKLELLCLPVFNDVRPMQGVAGLVDWRFCGHVSKLLLDSQVEWSRGSCLLLSGRPRLSVRRILFFGLGLASEFSEDFYRTACRDLLAIMDGLTIREFALPLPGRLENLIDKELALSLFLESRRSHRRHERIAVIEPTAEHRALAPVVEHELRRIRSVASFPPP